MAAPTGNKFWEARSTHGRDKIFSSPEVLEDSCRQYFKWIEENPLYAAEVVKHQGEGSLIDVPKMRAMSIDGICIFLGIGVKTWQRYRDEESYKDFWPVIEWAESVMREQKVSGAAAGLLSANIISRLLGLGENRSVDVTSGGKPISSPTIIVLEAASDDDSQD